MVPTAFLEHHLSGRIRLRIPAKRGDCSFFETARQDLAGTAAVKEVVANPHTGSLLIRYTGDVNGLATEAAERGMFTVQRPKAIARRTPKPAATAAPINTAVVGLSGLGLYQVVRGRSLGSASEICWNAYGAYRILDNPALALVLCGIGLWQTLRGDWLGPASALLFYALVNSNAARLEAIRSGRLHVAGFNTKSNPTAVACAGFWPFAMMAAADRSFGLSI